MLDYLRAGSFFQQSSFLFLSLLYLPPFFVSALDMCLTWLYLMNWLVHIFFYTPSGEEIINSWMSWQRLDWQPTFLPVVHLTDLLIDLFFSGNSYAFPYYSSNKNKKWQWINASNDYMTMTSNDCDFLMILREIIPQLCSCLHSLSYQ